MLRKGKTLEYIGRKRQRQNSRQMQLRDKSKDITKGVYIDTETESSNTIKTEHS